MKSRTMSGMLAGLGVCGIDLEEVIQDITAEGRDTMTP